MGLKLNLRGVELTLKKFIASLASGIVASKDTFSTFVNAKKLELKFNAQSIYLSEYLNQSFDATLKRIYIIDDATLFETYIYRTSESILAADQAYLFRTSETITEDEQVYLDRSGIAQGIDFQVLVPVALVALVTDAVFLASVRKYKLPDKTFEVITY